MIRVLLIKKVFLILIPLEYCASLKNFSLIWCSSCLFWNEKPQKIFQFSKVIQTGWYNGRLLIWSPMGQKNGSNNEVSILTRISLQENVWSFLPGSQKKVVVIMRWPYYRGGRKVGFHCSIVCSDWSSGRWKT